MRNPAERLRVIVAPIAATTTATTTTTSTAASSPDGMGGFETRLCADQPGCRLRATLNAVRRPGRVLMSGRYVGAEAEEDDMEPVGAMTLGVSYGG